MSVQERNKVWKRKRPVAVTIVAWGLVLLFVVRLYNVFQPLVPLHVLEQGVNGPLTAGLRLTALGYAVFLSASYLFQVVFGIIVLAGFLRMRRWAWVLLMAWTGLSLCITLVDYFYSSHANYIVMASDVIIAVALSQSDVQRIFGVRMDPDDTAS